MPRPIISTCSSKVWTRKPSEVVDWDVMGLNMLDLWYEGAMTHMAHPGAGFSQGQTLILIQSKTFADIYDALFNGGAAVLLHPNYSVLVSVDRQRTTPVWGHMQP